MTKPSISVVIPAYNEAGYIEKCLDSLLKQDALPLEIIVVDNNSHDDTAQIAASFDLVKVIRESKQGIVHARDTGFNAARGNIIARCDADSILPKTWIAQIITAFENSDIAAVTGPCTFYDLPKQLRNLKTSLRVTHTLVYFTGSKAMLGHEALFGSNMALSRKIWLKIRAETCRDESKMHEDTDIAIHIAAAGGVIQFDPKLQVGISMRRAKSSLPELITYIGRWTNTKLKHPPIEKR